MATRTTQVAVQEKVDAVSETLLTASQVAKMLCMSRQFVYLRAKDGSLPSIRMGKATRFRASDVAAYVEACRRGGVRAA